MYLVVGLEWNSSVQTGRRPPTSGERRPRPRCRVPRTATCRVTGDDRVSRAATRPLHSDSGVTQSRGRATFFSRTHCPSVFATRYGRTSRRVPVNRHRRTTVRCVTTPAVPFSATINVFVIYYVCLCFVS